MDTILRIVTASLLLGTVACNRQNAPTTPNGPVAAIETGSIDAALAGAHRLPSERARDMFRHPKETLSFFGLRPEMTVVEIWPGGGWYTAVLAPVLRDHGTLIIATMDPADTTFRGRFARQLRSKLAAAPDIYDQVVTGLLFKDKVEVAEAGSVDLVVSFRSAHNWIRWKDHEPEAYFKAIADALKPGGVFGIVQHRARDGAPNATTGQVGYLAESLVIKLAEQAGLELVARSEINANPRDDRTHPEGVWSLPPTLRGGDVDRARYNAIGESDRMTLKFVKPVSP